MAPSLLTARRLCGVALVFLTGALLPAAAPAETLETTLTIGEGWAVVRELRRMDLIAGEQELLLDGIPAQADLSSLTIRTRRIPVQMLDWERIDAGALPSSSHGAVNLAVTPAGEIRGVPHLQASGTDGPVRCRIRIPVGGARSLEIVYRLNGMGWTSYYQVYMRGEPDGLDESVGLDLTGFVRIDNATGRSFSNTLVRLIGADPRLPREPERRPGILLLADSPLSRLWEAPVVDAPPEFVYRMPRRINLPAHAETEVHFIASHRIPATRVYVLDSRDVPLTLTGAFRPLNQYLVFNNTAANRLGWALPPGPVEVFHGVVRRTMRLPGFLPHTPINREIRIDMGPTETVRGMRRSLRRTEPAFGFYEELFQLAVENRRPGAIAVEIYERPPLSLTWDVQRATEEYEVAAGRLRMAPRVRGGETREVEIRLRFHLPTL